MIKPHQYSTAPNSRARRHSPRAHLNGHTYHGHARRSATLLADPLGSSNGWYDLSVTIGGDSSWSRRYIGHLEDGSASVTG